MKIARILTVAGLATLAWQGTQSLAHHAFSAEFDPNRPLLLKGPVTRVEWVNPHAWIHLEVTNEDGSVEQWMVEGGTPNTLLRRGINKNTIKPGTYIVVDGYQSKDRSNRANGRNITMADGSKLFMGSSGTGAPRDGADPTEN
jgi:DNA/RNA endonuclease YhcR with UshA esterase domain